MVGITAFGGVGEIGGNKILLEGGGSSLMLDFGKSFGLEGAYFDEFMKPRNSSAMGDLLDLGMMPPLRGLYRKDYVERLARWEYDERPLVDAVIVSHAHMDHIGYVPYLRWDIPLLCSEASKKIMETFDSVGVGLDAQLLTLKENFQIYRNSRGGHSRKVGPRAEVHFREVADASGGISFGNAEVRGIPVDHSLPGAMAYVISIDGKDIVYTGDLRLHGKRRKATGRFFDTISGLERPVVLTEGTRVKRSSDEGKEDGEGMTEAQVETEIASHMEGRKGHVFATWPIRDTDRLESFAKAAQRAGRRLLISLKQAKLLDTMDGTDGAMCVGDYGTGILIPRKGWGAWGHPAYPEKIGMEDYSTWERPYLSHPAAVTVEEARKDPGEYVIRCDTYEMTALLDFKPDGGLYIRSSTEPFSDEMQLDLERTRRWLALFDLKEVHAHASGHISRNELFENLSRLDRPVIIPVHTESPEEFKELGDVRFPVQGERMDI